VNLRAVSLAVVAVLALQGCTKTVYYAVLAPHAAMDDSKGCFRQCQMLQAGQTKQFLKCVDICPDSRTIKEKRCEEVQYDDQAYGCVTAQNQTFDGVAFGIGIGLLALVNVLLFFAFVASVDTSSDSVK
jgi:hypothetical protein